MNIIKQIISKFKEEATVTPQVLMDMQGMRERNEKRMNQVKKEMGDKWILADCHKKTKLDEPRPV